MKKKVAIIGSGFAGLSAACYLAKSGYHVTVYEKNKNYGGRASQLCESGFTFDMGPTWYWMPDIFERFFSDFSKKVDDRYALAKLDPAYRVYFGIDDYVDVDGEMEKISQQFEKIEAGSAQKLKKFIQKAEDNYRIAIHDLVYRPGRSPWELVTLKTLTRVRDFFFTVAHDVRKEFAHPKLIRILEFPVLFLGAKPDKTPSFYNFMNYADFGLGTFYPEGGMYSVVKSMKALAEELGATFVNDCAIKKIDVKDGVARGLVADNAHFPADVVVSGADYRHSEQLLDMPYRQYGDAYWQKKVFAPSALLFYLGFDKPIQEVLHHTLFFDVDFDAHAAAIYDRPKWPEEPLFYVSFSSKSDPAVAPAGHEAVTALVPLAPGLRDDEEQRERIFDAVLTRMERCTRQPLRAHMVYKKTFGVNDFAARYNAYKGNAYGLANTLLQTAFLRPGLMSKKVANLFFTGQLTVPGPGVPPALISGKLVAELVQKRYPS